MNLYLVHGATWDDALTFGVYDTKQKAQQRIESLKATYQYKRWDFETRKIKVNQDIEEC